MPRGLTDYNSKAGLESRINGSGATNDRTQFIMYAQINSWRQTGADIQTNRRTYRRMDRQKDGRTDRLTGEKDRQREKHVCNIFRQPPIYIRWNNENNDETEIDTNRSMYDLFILREQFMMQWNNDNGPKLLWIGLVIKVFLLWAMISMELLKISNDVCIMSMCYLQYSNIMSTSSIRNPTRLDYQFKHMPKWNPN